MKYLILLIPLTALAEPVDVQGWYYREQQRQYQDAQLEVQRDIERDLRDQQFELERQERDQFYNRLSEEHREFIRKHTWKPE